MNSQKELRRGHNQARALAKELSKLIKIPCCEPPILKLPQGESQHKLSATKRVSNANSSFVESGEKLFGNILLIDDIATTGSTLNRCSELLKMAGANQVVCITPATTLFYKDEIAD